MGTDRVTVAASNESLHHSTTTSHSSSSKPRRATTPSVGTSPPPSHRRYLPLLLQVARPRTASTLGAPRERAGQLSIRAAAAAIVFFSSRVRSKMMMAPLGAEPRGGGTRCREGEVVE